MPATPSCWNLIAVGLPVAVALLGALQLGGGGTGDWAGRLGGGVLFVMVVAGACVLGAVAAVVALVRGEERMWLSVLALILNLCVALPVAGLLLRD